MGDEPPKTPTGQDLVTAMADSPLHDVPFGEPTDQPATAQAKQLRERAAKAGLRFDAYFVPTVADWALGEIEKGRFTCPGEVVFVAMQVFRELEAFPDLKAELLRRHIQQSMDDPTPAIPAEEAFARLRAHLKEQRELTPPRWVKDAEGG